MAGMSVDDILAGFAARTDPKALEGTARYGIATTAAFGVPVPELRALAKKIIAESGRTNPERHRIAADLWATGVHEARLVAGMVDLPALVTPDQMDRWAADLDSWDVCDQLCMNLFAETAFAWGKAIEWSGREEEFVKRAGFALIATLAHRAKKSPDEAFLPLLAAIEREAGDERNYVKKAVNWALRDIGKRNAALNAEAVATARRIAASGTRAGRWIASDALRELEGEKVQKKLGIAAP